MKPIVFALPGNESLAKNIAISIHAEEGEVIIREFPDGETYVRVLSDVKNKEIIIISTLVDPNKKILPLYFLSKTIKSLGARSVCLISPYLSYMRQDKVFISGEGITSEYFASLMSSFIDKLITIDPHLHRRNNINEIYTIPCEILHASMLISSYIRKYIKDPILIGPDAESKQWVSVVAENANAPFIILEKIRLGDKNVNISFPNIEEFKDHTPVLVDDIISTARTMIETVKHLKKLNMKPPVCIGVHAVFSDNSYENLKDSGVSQIITCNTIEHESNKIDITELIAKKI